MEKIITIFAISIFAMTLYLLPASTASAEDEAVEQKAYVDLDGDGFDDNAPDENSDGIPDDVESGKSKIDEHSFEGGEQIAAFTPLQDIGQYNIDEYLPNSEIFGRLKFSTRAQSSFRGGFDIGNNFGSETGIGCGALSGCAGGVCH